MLWASWNCFNLKIKSDYGKIETTEKVSLLAIFTDNHAMEEPVYVYFHGTATQVTNEFQELLDSNVHIFWGTNQIDTERLTGCIQGWEIDIDSGMSALDDLVVLSTLKVCCQLLGKRNGFGEDHSANVLRIRLSYSSTKSSRKIRAQAPNSYFIDRFLSVPNHNSTVTLGHDSIGIRPNEKAVLSLGKGKFNRGEGGLESLDGLFNGFYDTHNSLAISASRNLTGSRVQSESYGSALGRGKEMGLASEDEREDMGRNVADALGALGGLGGDDLL